MEEIIHGGDIYGKQEMLDFSENINPLGLPQSVKTALINAVDTFAFYPDPLCRDLKTTLAEKLQINPDWIAFGNGAVDLIYRIALALHPKRALTLAPTFAEYEYALHAADCNTAFHTLYEKDAFKVTETLLKKLSPALDLLILCNPNNPTGQPIGKELMLRILKRCKEYEIIVLVDESFITFLDSSTEETIINELSQFPNLIILNAFTKTYAMAGLRLGYILCSDSIKQKTIQHFAPPWNISVPAQIAGITALNDTNYLSQTHELLISERTWLAGALAKCGVNMFGSYADYLFFKCNACPELAIKLEEHGILIRSCANYRGLDGRFFRVGIKTHDKNEKLAKTIAELLGRG